MAARTFLSPEQFEELKNSYLKSSSLKLKAIEQDVRIFSNRMTDPLLADVQKRAQEEKVNVFLMGSWAREQMCPTSDIDLLILGDETEVQRFSEEFQNRSASIRARWPADSKDWTKEAVFSDLISYIFAKPVRPADAPILEAQQKHAREMWMKHPLWMQQLLDERVTRHARFENQPNGLEPNLKFCVGGIRDAVQGLALIDIYGLNNEMGEKNKARLQHNLSLLIWIRQRLQLLGLSDQFHVQHQMDFQKQFVDESHKEFMRRVHLALTDNHVLTEGLVDLCKQPTKKRKPADLQSLLKDGSRKTQMELRLQLGGEEFDFAKDKELTTLIKDLFQITTKPALLAAFFHSGLAAAVFPDWQRIEGLIQINQYHRLTVDAHTLQAVLETLKAYKSSTWMRGLQAVAKAFSEDDWLILLWSAYFHDLCKGQKEAHEIAGEKVARQVLKALGYKADIIENTAWIVRNHLILSHAAFRQNPNSSTTWSDLHEQGVAGRKLDLLAVFTALDIRATNPEAWTDWKADLLAELHSKLNSQPATRLFQILKKDDSDWVQQIDTAILEWIPEKVLLKDFSSAKKTKTDLPILVHRGDRQHLWVRFHRRKDSAGLFKQFTHQLYGCGLNIQEAYIHTIDGLGVYDWFKIKTKKTPDQLRKILSLPTSEKASGTGVPKVDFQSIRLMSQDEKEGVISFRGQDQKGALIVAAQALFEMGLSIRWARVHTWGKTIDDVFGVKSVMNLPEVVQRLKTQHQSVVEQK